MVGGSHLASPAQPSLGSVTLPEVHVEACHAHILIPPELIEGKFSCYHKTQLGVRGTLVIV